MRVSVVGAGLAGCEAASMLARRGIPVDLYEMKPQKFSPAHTRPGFAELVCSNSLKAMRVNSAAGLLKAEMRMLGSLCLAAADASQVPAGGALAVDRGLFSDFVTREIRENPLINIIEGELTEIPDGRVIIATGPLTSPAMSDAVARLCGARSLSFYDAAAPIIETSSIDFEKVFYAARYGRGDDDYINCPFSKEEYERFYTELVGATSAELHEIDTAEFRVYEGCMPVEVMAKRGPDTLRFGPMKPVGLRDPRTGHRPWAVVQLRPENSEKTLYNLVGFQTNLKFPEQKRVFSLIPGLENAEFSRYGVMHRNTFINSPELLAGDFSLKSNPAVRFAGQITGVEGYMESAMSGMVAGLALACELTGKSLPDFGECTMTGSLIRHVTAYSGRDFQPMGANMGILPPVEPHIRDKAERYGALAERALDSIARAVESLK